MHPPTEVSPAVEIVWLRVLGGPNIWSIRPVLELQIDAPGFRFDRWDAADELLVSQGISGTKAVREGRADGQESLAAWLGDVGVKLQTAGQTPVSYHGWRPSLTSRGFRLAVEFVESDIAKAALDFALRWLNALSSQGTLDLAGEWEAFRDLAYDARIGNSTGPTVDAAAARGIPYLRLDAESLVQLGHGCRQRRIRRAATDRTGFIANDISTDKEMTKAILREIGIPVPLGRPVVDAEDACRAAHDAGWPVVVKPQDADYGNGVAVHVGSEDEVRKAYAAAREWSEGVLVEHHVLGGLFRLLVIGGRLVAAVRRDSPYVVGDGKHTLLQLVELTNYDPRRGGDYESPFQRTLRETGEVPILTVDSRPHDSVPALGEMVLWRPNVYLKSGGIHLDQADLVHPEIARLAIDATHAVGLDVAGLDVIATDLAKSPDEQDFAVIEVNSEPSIALHLEPLCAPSRPVGEAIVESLFPAPESGRIPVVAVLGQAGDLSAARELVLKRFAGRANIGLASRMGAWLDGRQLGEACPSVRGNLSRLWRHPRTEMVVVHLTLEDVLQEGLPFDRCDELIEYPFRPGNLESGESSCPEERQQALDCLRAALTIRGLAS